MKLHQSTFDEVKEAHEGGANSSQIAEEMNLDLEEVNMALSSKSFKAYSSSEKRSEKTMEIANIPNGIIESVSGLIGQIQPEVKKIDFSKPISEQDMEILKLHLAYIKTFTDLAKIKLLYEKLR